MIEHYMLSALQLDAIGRVCDYALEHPNDFMRITTYNDSNLDTKKDSVMLGIIREKINDLYRIKERGPYILCFEFAHEQMDALGHALTFYITQHMSLEATRTLGVVLQNFPDFEQRKQSNLTDVYSIPERTNKYVPDPV
jgi:hypothetical protein